MHVGGIQWLNNKGPMKGQHFHELHKGHVIGG